MTFEQARNEIISRLEEHMGCPVILSDQISEIPKCPYCYYSVLAPRISTHSFGFQEVKNTKQGEILIRSESVKATMSFTFCSMNREGDNSYIFGEDEALAFAEKANGFFLLNNHNIFTEHGDIVINTVGSVANRSGYLVEDVIRRYGFDISFSYIRTDTMPTITIKKVRCVPKK